MIHNKAMLSCSERLPKLWYTGEVLCNSCGLVRYPSQEGIVVRRLPFVADQSLHLLEEPSDPILVGSEAWYGWLAAEQHPSFAFSNQLGTFTVRRERRRQHGYWYLYHKQGGKLRKAYVGKTEEMTLERLNAITATLVVQGDLRADADAHLPAPRSTVDRNDPPLATPLRPRASFAGSQYAPAHNLPAQLTPLMGRDQEVAAVCTLLRRKEVRLLTLTGTGGIGKTRLAIQAATQVLADFPDGVCFVSLAPLSDPALVLSTIAQALDVKESGASPFSDLLIAFLRDKHLLLCLDNFEHLLPAAAQLTDLLTACPHLTLLVTSRAVLHVQGEHRFPVPPLAVPDLTQRPPSVETVLSSAAVALFLQRAQAVQPTFQLTSTNARPIASVCIRLEGLPLAIELAAARIPLFPPQALLARLSQRLELLTSGTRDAPARQHTLRNSIAWSYHLLDEAEQRLFRRLAIFVGGCTLQAVEAVCEALGDGTGKVLESVASLIEKSLLQPTEPEGEEPRLRMLETIREYALEELFASGELETTQQAHAAYYVRLSEQAEAELEGPRQARWLERLEREYDNLRAALRWGLEPRAGEEGEHRKELGLRLGGALGQFWIRRSHLREGRAFLEQALAASPRAAPVLRAKALRVAANLAMVQFDKRAQVRAVEGLALYQQQADQAGIASCLHLLGVCALWRGAYGQARARFQESAALFRSLGNKARLGWSLVFQGVADHMQGEHVEARTHYEEALALFRDLGIVEGRAMMHFLLGLVLFYWQEDALTARSFLEEASRLFRAEGNTAGLAISLLRSAEIALLGQGDLALASVLAEEALGFFRELSYKGGMADALFVLARVQARQGNYSAARSRYEDILTLAREGDDTGHIHVAYRVEYSRDLPGRPSEHDEPWNIPFYLEGLAQVVAAQGEGAWAARLWGAAHAMRESMNAPLPMVFRMEYEQAIATARAQMGEKLFTAAWTQGRAMTLEQVLAAQRAVTIPARAEARSYSVSPPGKASPSPDGLTAREVEVLRLVAQGLTNEQVAQRLVISPRTVDSHLSAIYSKIGVSSRVAATRYAMQQHLV